MSDEVENDEVVTGIVNLVKRIQKIETRLTVLEAVLSGKFKGGANANGETKKWNDWARKVILKVLEWLVVIVAAIVGAKLTGL